MIQKQNKNLLPGLDFIILIAVFGFAVSFAGLLLPFSKTPISKEGQNNTLVPYGDKSSNKSLQIKSVKLNSTSSETPEEESETCEGATTTTKKKSTTTTTKKPGLICDVCDNAGGKCRKSQTAWTDKCPTVVCEECKPKETTTTTSRPRQTTTTTKPKTNFTEEYELN